jgi:hypothetical protein
VKILCTVHAKPALVVGFGPGKKGRPMVMVITDGQLKAVRLKDVILDDIPEALRASVVPMPERKKG